MKELSLFTGAGGGVLGTKLLGFRHVGYVEYENYCQKIIKQRIADGILDAAPIFGDIRKFISEGYADAYSGMVDVVTAGFPCQPFSVAGKRKGENDDRNMWPATIETVRRVRPRYAFFENVPGIMGTAYFRKILREITESGYDCRWCVLGASDVGANHRRKRLWILAYAKSEQAIRERQRRFFPITTQCGQDVADSKHGRMAQRRGTFATVSVGTFTGGIEGNDRKSVSEEEEVFSNTKSAECEQSRGTRSGWKGFTDNGWWAVEPDVGRVVDELAYKLDFTKTVM